MKGEKAILKIIGTGMRGEGVARLNNLAVFIEGALLNETVEAIIFEKKKKFARARIIKVIEKSPLRVEPECPVFYRCGGCSLQHINYSEQLNIKQSELINCLTKQLNYIPSVEEIVPSDKIFAYRNKLQIPITTVNGKVVAGFYKDKSHIVVPVTKCPLHGNWAEDVINAFLSYANANALSVYDETRHTGLMRHLVARRIGSSVSVVCVINGESLPATDDLISRLKERIENFSLHISVNKTKTNVIMGERLKLLYGKDRIAADICGLKVKVSPLTFMQVNDYIRDLIYRKVADIARSGIVIDAYSGSGILTALVARRAGLAVGIEIVPEAVKDADSLMKENNLEGRMINICGDIGDVLPEIMRVKGGDIYNKLLSIKQRYADASGEYDEKRTFSRTDIDKNGGLCYINNIKGASQCGDNDGQADTDALSDGDNTQFPEFKTEFQEITLILDPPRKGCDIKVINTILTAMPDRIVYISCNPSTLARDLAFLSPTYSITSISPYDMFPNTPHVETVVLITRAEK
jgi:23S rRNA (uracil1939-C5)-methyltransferase